jgi:pantothenate kinase
MAQIAHHNAIRHNVSRIYFGGFFIRNHAPSMTRISMGINYWSKGGQKVACLPHVRV